MLFSNAAALALSAATGGDTKGDEVLMIRATVESFIHLKEWKCARGLLRTVWCLHCVPSVSAEERSEIQ